MRVEKNHAHADTSYKAINAVDFIRFFFNVLEVKLKGYQSLNVHLPFEIQHPYEFPNLWTGLLFIRFGELLKALFGIKLYWENAPLLETTLWGLKHGQANFDLIPPNIDLCLDTGHLILGTRNPKKRIRYFLNRFGKRIKHVHLHENDLKHDLHWKPKKYLDKKLVKEIIQGRTWIVERPS